MKIAIATIKMSTRTGTEMVTVDLALGLRRRGHEVFVFTSELGETAEELRAKDIVVIDDLRNAPFEPDVIHANQSAVLLQALIRFRRAVGVYVGHDATFFQNAPVDLTRIRAYVAVDRINRERIERQVPRVKGAVRLIHNAVDLGRFSVRGPLPAKPRKALVLTKYSGHVEAVRQACDACQIACEAIGPGVNAVVADLTPLLHAADIVFATARMAIEALAVGCAVVVCDARGLAGMVTTQNVAAWRDDNFGIGILKSAVTSDIIVSEIQRYDAEDAAAACAYMRRNSGLEQAIDAFEGVYKRAVEENSFVDPDSEAIELSSALREWLPGLDGDALVASSHLTYRRHALLAQQAVKLEEEHMAKLRRMQADHAAVLHRLQEEKAAGDRTLRSRSALARRLGAMLLFGKETKA